MPKPVHGQRVGEVTRLLAKLKSGDEGAYDQLFPLVYDALRRAAERQLQRERIGHTLQPTALVHEAYLKLVGSPTGDWQNREQFVGVAARAMRQILVDHARRRNAAKRGGGVVPVNLADDALGIDLPMDDLIALDDALTGLEALNPRLRSLVELRFFGGFTEAEAAKHLGVTARTVRRDWTKARAWLYKELYPPEPA